MVKFGCISSNKQPAYIFEVYKLETSLISEYGPSWKFSRAITRRTLPSVTEALRAVDKEAPNSNLMLQHYDKYVDALYKAGAEIIELDPVKDFPGSLFVEDTGPLLARRGSSCKSWRSTSTRRS